MEVAESLLSWSFMKRRKSPYLILTAFCVTVILDKGLFLYNSTKKFTTLVSIKEMLKICKILHKNELLSFYKSI